MSDNSDVVKETSLAAVTDDSSAAEFTEILPVERLTGNSCSSEFIRSALEAKPDDLRDAKQEPDDENDSKDSHYFVKVRY